jgi:hypothetical protein
MCVSLVTSSLHGVETTASVSQLSAYNEEWDIPSKNENGSIPIGNGDLAANVWVEPNGATLKAKQSIEDPVENEKSNSYNGSCSYDFEG